MVAWLQLTHVQRVDTSKVNKGGVCDGGLVATSHVQRVDTSKVNKVRIRKHPISGHVRCGSPGKQVRQDPRF